MGKRNNLTDDCVENHIREHMRMYLEEHEASLHDLAEALEVPYETIRDFYYGRSNSVKIDRLIKFANLLKLPVEVVCGKELLDEQTDRVCSAMRNLPPRFRYIVTWTAEELQRRYDDPITKFKSVPLKKIHCQRGQHVITTDIETIDISHVEPSIRAKTIMAIRYSCDCMMPYITPFDTMLVANDRPIMDGDICAVISSERFWILRKKGDDFFYMNDEFASHIKNADVIIGYLCERIEN